jgi:hypothetical protein
MAAPSFLERLLDKVKLHIVKYDTDDMCLARTEGLTVIQVPHLTWRFWCTCIVLAAASGYVLLGAIQIASSQARTYAAAVAPADSAAAPYDNCDDDDDANDIAADDDNDDDGNGGGDSGADQPLRTAAPSPHGGAGALPRAATSRSL